MYRKLIIVILILFLRDQHIVQITVMIYMQLGMLIYIMKVRPMDKWYYNAFVMLNEYMLMMSSVCAFLFTGFVYRPTSRNGLGNLWLFLITFPLILDGMFIWIFSFLKLKWGAEAWILRR